MALIPRIFNPAVGLLDRLRYSFKFSLISLCFALPIALLIHMLFTEIGERIAFAEKERDGVAYPQALAGVRAVPQLAGQGPAPDTGARLAAAARNRRCGDQGNRCRNGPDRRDGKGEF
jgi:hypothetical protein